MKLDLTSMKKAKKELLDLREKNESTFNGEKIEYLLDAINTYEIIITEINELYCKEMADNILDELNEIHDLFKDFEFLSKIISTTIRHVNQKLPELQICNDEVKARIKELEKNAPQCTKCKNKLIIRDGKGTYFWGCPDFPDCWGKRWLTKEEEVWLSEGIRIEDIDDENPEEKNSITGKEIIKMLAQGVNPLTGVVLPDDSFINNHNIVRALSEAVQCMDIKETSGEDLLMDEDEEKVFQLLREWRLQLSRERNIPAFVIIENKPLIRVSKMKPKTLEELKDIKGFGDMRVSEYGENILNIVNKIFLKP